jgi:deoxyribodipyrimidine photo-lyase
MAVNLFIFRRDLRIDDNIALQRQVEHILQSKSTSETILPIFIFNSNQIDPKKNKYYSKNSVEFMIQCLHSLNKQLFNKLNYFESNGDDIMILNSIIVKLKKKNKTVKTIAYNEDFTPYALKRDKQIKEWCNNNNITLITAEDYTLMPLNSVQTGNKTWFSVYTPFYRKSIANANIIPPVEYMNKKNLVNILYSNYIGDIKQDAIEKYYSNTPNKMLFVNGGRDNAMKILDNISKGIFANYDKERNYPAQAGTTRLSAYLKFGCVSVREVYEVIKKEYGINHGLIRELFWRDFYANITFNKSRILEGQIGKINLAFKEKYDSIKWQYNEEWYNKWCKGETGVPLVDAAMRQLNTTGWMHNRCRMIVACFLCKDMLMDWREGERYFASHLIDYDPSSNNGGWQFCSSTGVDAQPYFRIFNPYTQSLKFDPECKYIKYWIPELQDVPIQHIHQWNNKYNLYITENNTNSNKKTYYAPMLDHSKQSKLAIEIFKKIS